MAHHYRQQLFNELGCGILHFLVYVALGNRKHVNQYFFGSVRNDFLQIDGVYPIDLKDNHSQ